MTSSSQVGTPATGYRGANETQSLLPVTCKLLLEAKTNDEGGHKIINGQAVTQVSIVGLVHACQEQAAWIVYTIDDGTGMIDTKDFKDESANNRTQFREGMYVKAIGKVSLYQGNVSLTAHKIMPLGSSNEITHHLISVCHAHIANKKYCTTVGAGLAQTTATVAGNDEDMGNDETENLTPIQKAVFEAIKAREESHEHGANIPDLMNAMSGQFDPAAIRQAITDLTSEGSVYDTVSDEWVKTT